MSYPPVDSPHPFVAYQRPAVEANTVVELAREFHERMDTRRSVRMFSDEPVPLEAVEYAIRAASTAPSGAHRQPWTFVVIGNSWSM